MHDAGPRLIELDDDALERLAVRLERLVQGLRGVSTPAGMRTRRDFEARLDAVRAELQRRLV